MPVHIQQVRKTNEHDMENILYNCTVKIFTHMKQVE